MTKPSTKLALATWATAFVALGSSGTAGAVPSGPTNAAQTVNALHASGFRVMLNKVGTGLLEKCAVTAVRPGQTYERTDSGAPGAGGSIVTTVMSKTVYVDVVC